MHRSTYDGQWVSSIINKPASFPAVSNGAPSFAEFSLPKAVYNRALPISIEKFKDSQQVKKFCTSKDARLFYDKLLKMLSESKKRTTSCAQETSNKFFKCLGDQTLGEDSFFF